MEVAESESWMRKEEGGVRVGVEEGEGRIEVSWRRDGRDGVGGEGEERAWRRRRRVPGVRDAIDGE